VSKILQFIPTNFEIHQNFEKDFEIYQKISTIISIVSKFGQNFDCFLKLRRQNFEKP